MKKPYWQSGFWIFWLVMFVGICIGYSFIAQPSEWRSAIYPKVDMAMREFNNHKAAYEKKLDDLNTKIDLVNAELKAHTSRAHVYAERPKK